MEVIKDNECKEYMQGWNANNCGKHFLSNPYGCLAYDGELYRLWQKGFNDNQAVWDSPGRIPQPFSEQRVLNAFTITNQAL